MNSKTFFIGSYAEPGETCIYKCELDMTNGAVSVAGSIRGIENPTYITRHPSLDVLYAVEENDNSAVYAIDAGSGKIFDRHECSGRAACHVSVRSDGKYISVSNYTSGSLCVIRLKENGSFGKFFTLKEFHSSGTHPLRQQEAHMHYSRFVKDSGDNGCNFYLYACDLGGNTVYRLSQEKGGALAGETRPFQFNEAAGPRHFVIIGDKVYVICEMEGAVNVFSLSGGDEKKEDAPLQTIDLLPEGVDRKTLPVVDYDAYGAGIKATADGKYIVASVRGADELVVLRVLKDGLTEVACRCSCGGRIPRDLEIIDDIVICANQFSNSVTVFRLDATGASLDFLYELKNIHVPTCVSFYR